MTTIYDSVRKIKNDLHAMRSQLSNNLAVHAETQDKDILEERKVLQFKIKAYEELLDNLDRNYNVRSTINE